MVHQPACGPVEVDAENVDGQVWGDIESAHAEGACALASGGLPYCDVVGRRASAMAWATRFRWGVSAGRASRMPVMVLRPRSGGVLADLG